jgi:penicillin amidase
MESRRGRPTWRVTTFVVRAVMSAIALFAAPVLAAEAPHVDGSNAPFVLTRDKNGVVHVTAPDEPSLAFAQGYVHARDRLFQMDLLRRTASGTLAELLGEDVLADDIELRTIGLRRSAERTLPLLGNQLRRALEAYARGVNAFKKANPAPPEYAVLGLEKIVAWTPLDSVSIAKLLAFQLSADFEDIDRSEALIAYQAALGPTSGVALFFEDLWRIAPFEPIAAVPRGAETARAGEPSLPALGGAAPGDTLPALTGDWKRRLSNARVMRQILRARHDGPGSNAFVVSGRLTESGGPLLANDPHLDLSVPSVLYPIHFRAPRAGFDIRGASFPGVPYVLQGVTRHLAWGITTSGVDVTDVYQEQLVPDPDSPSGLSTLFRGGKEFVISIPQKFRVNRGGNLVDVPVADEQGGRTFIVPRRNHGPIIASLADGRALSLQWAGFGPTFELEAFRGLNRARSRQDFEAALQKLDVASQNFLYADRTGTIAYYLSGEIPLREDVQAQVPIVPPFLIRDGQGGQEWITLAKRPKDQALPYAVLPGNEMPKAIDPVVGYLISANNDPLGDTFDNNALNQLRPGGGIRYLGADYNIGIRAKRIEGLIETLGDRKDLSLEDMQVIQADVTMLDAEVFVPYISRAFDAAVLSSEPRLKALSADSRVTKAVQRLRSWRFTAPTGEPEGYDAADQDGRLLPVSAPEIEESIAAAIYSMWRAYMIANTIDRTLGDLPTPRSRYAIRAVRHLLDTFELNQGIGASGLNFFAIPDVTDAATRRDIIILQSLRDALDRLASDAFAPAFAHSVDQNDYRWGRLHRLEANHPLGGPFSLTTPEGPYPPPFDGLPGLPTDGGFETVDRATHDVRAGLPGGADPVNDFVFTFGPVDRFAVELGSAGNRAENALPGGISGVLGSEYYVNLFGPWLTNEAFVFEDR